jgi:hypothetical protein
MNPYRWIEHFRKNRMNRREPNWSAPITLSSEVITPLLRSIEQFRLGDGGGPASLIAFNAERFRSRDDETKQLVHMWFDEEKEHARLLAGLVDRFHGTHITGHWSFTAFCWSRKYFGVRFELIVLLLTEISSTVYYRMIRRHTNDEVVRAVCKLILRDETGHVAFHRARMAHEQASLGQFWELRFRSLGYLAATMLWVNHAPALKAIGGTRREFYRDVTRELSRFVRLVRAEANREVDA